MTQRKRIGSRAITPDNQLETLNREWLPVLQQITKAPVISGSRSGATASVLAAVLTALQNAGIITDNTTP